MNNAFFVPIQHGKYFTCCETAMLIALPEIASIIESYMWNSNNKGRPKCHSVEVNFIISFQLIDDIMNERDLKKNNNEKQIFC